MCAAMAQAMQTQGWVLHAPVQLRYRWWRLSGARAWCA
jgi:hypothetical protein